MVIPAFAMDPYLWIHFAGLAAVPLFLEITWFSLALGDSFSPLELLPVALLGILPIFWMQWKRPFNIYSLLLWYIRYDALTTEQRQVLGLYKSRSHKLLTIVVSLLMIPLLWLIYQQAPLSSGIAQQFLPPVRILALILSMLAFLLANLFVQVALSTLLVMILLKKDPTSLGAWETGKIKEDFTSIGLPVRQIVPPLKTNNT